MPDELVKLGLFELKKPVGAGGMGVVWKAIHSPTDLPVAVKVMTATHARNERGRLAFGNEVRAMARLNHPGVALVLDQGVVTEAAVRAAERAGDRTLVAGSPFFAMELATLGTLRDKKRPLRWLKMKRVLISILDALAHAHARGVIHRDLKPANVLIAEGDVGQEVYKLTDFGIAQAIGGHSPAWSGASRVSGTPHYMAPEQILGNWRDQGPATDLYALGCVAYQLAAGHPPYWGAKGDDLHRCHLKVPAPLLRSVHAVPDGFQGWLGRLLAKHPADRFPFAADAKFALERLKSPAGGRKSTESAQTAETPAVLDLLVDLSGSTVMDLHDEVTRAPEPGEGPFGVIADADHDTVFESEMHTREVLSISLSDGDVQVELRTGATRSDWTGTAGRLDLAAWQRESRLRSDVDVAPRLPAPMPATWRRKKTRRHSMKLVGAGLGLYGLRPIPLVDRESVRDLLWTNLHRVRATGRAHLVVLKGNAGCGKSRVVEWTCQRALEVAAAKVLKASHSPMLSRADGVGRMVADHIAAVGLDRPDMLQRSIRYIHERPLPSDTPLDAAALSDLMAPAEDMGGAGELDPTATQELRVRLVTPEERHAVIRKLLLRVSANRPVIVWLDDVQWGSDAISLAQFVMQSQESTPVPVLFVMTARDEALTTRPALAAQLTELSKLENCEERLMDPLGPKAHTTLVNELLGLEGELAAEVVDRTAGNPLFAVQLVGDWVQRGILLATETGFVRRPGETTTLPDDIHGLWRDRIAQLATDVGSGAVERVQHVLELAAALGREIQVEEWAEVALQAEVSIPLGLVEAMLTRRMAEPAELGWQFAHAMLRESLERTAREANHWHHHHRACAAMLATRYNDDPAQIERTSQHLVAAGQLEASIGPLLAAAQQRFQRSDFDAAHELFEQRHNAMNAIGAPRNDVRRGDGMVRRARTYVLQGRIREAGYLLEQAKAAAQEHNWPGVMARAETARGYVALNAGDTGASVAAFAAGLEAYKMAPPDPRGLGDCLSGIGKAHMWRRELDEARHFLHEAYQLQNEHCQWYELGITMRGLANVYQCEEDNDRAAEFLNRAVATYEHLGDRVQTAACVNDLGELERWANRLDSAEALYRRALSLYLAAGSLDSGTPRLNLALVLLERRRFGEAAALFQQERDELLRKGRPVDLLWVHAGLLPCVAAANDWNGWELHLAQIKALLEQSGYVDEDIPRYTQMGGDLAVEAGQPARALEAYQLAHAQWRLAERFVEAKLLSEKIDAIS